MLSAAPQSFKPSRMLAVNSSSLRFAVEQIPAQGLQLRFSEPYSEILRLIQAQPEKDLEAALYLPIAGILEVYRVGSKVDVRGHYSLVYRALCDRCGQEIEGSIEGQLNTFLMPIRQFSPYDNSSKPYERPQSPSGRHKPSRRRAINRAVSQRGFDQVQKQIHEDHAFSAFDGKIVDLYPLLRESVLLQLPLQWRCKDRGQVCIKIKESTDSHKEGLFAEVLRKKLTK